MPDEGLAPAAPATEAPAVTLGVLFRCFTEISFSSFGGALAWAHRMLVEQRHWLTQREFTELWSLGQALPGPNIVNMAVFVGTRFQGAAGAAVAFAGLVLAPLVVWLPLSAFYSQIGQFELVRAVLHGVAMVAAGLVLATGIKMALPYRHHPSALAMLALAFVAVGLLHWPLLLVLLVLVPPSIVLAWRRAA